jgi:hypothetical protein
MAQSFSWISWASVSLEGALSACLSDKLTLLSDKPVEYSPRPHYNKLTMEILRPFKIMLKIRAIDNTARLSAESSIPVSEADCRICPDPCDQGNERTTILKM